MVFDLQGYPLKGTVLPFSFPQIFGGEVERTASGRFRKRWKSDIARPHSKLGSPQEIAELNR